MPLCAQELNDVCMINEARRTVVAARPHTECAGLAKVGVCFAHLCAQSD